MVILHSCGNATTMGRAKKIHWCQTWRCCGTFEKSYFWVPGFARKADDPTNAHEEKDETTPGAEDCEGPSPCLSRNPIRNLSFQSSISIIYVLLRLSCTEKLAVENQTDKAPVLVYSFATSNKSWKKNNHSKLVGQRQCNNPAFSDPARCCPKQERVVQCKCSTSMNKSTHQKFTTYVCICILLKFQWHMLFNSKARQNSIACKLRHGHWLTCSTLKSIPNDIQSQ